MKILYLHQYFVFPKDSGGTRSYDLAHAFLKQGHHVEIVTTSAFIRDRDFSQRWTCIEKDGLVIHVLKLDYGNDLSYFKRVLVFLQFAIYSSRKLLKLNGDVVLASSTPLTIGVPALIKRALNRTPFIFEVRDVWPEGVIAVGAITNPILCKLLYLMEKLIYNRAVFLVALSSDMKGSICARYPQLVNKTIVIENISQIDRFQSLTEDRHVNLETLIGFKPRFSVLYAGTFGKINGLHYVVDLAAEMLTLDKSVVFLLMGQGAEKKNLIAAAKEKALFEKNIFFVEPVSKSDLPKIYKVVDMGASFVLDHKVLWANSANKFFDTLAAKKPILINYEGWQADVIRAEDMGYVLPTTEKRSMEDVEAFIRYTYDGTLLAQQGASALDIAKKHYSLDVAAKKYNGLFVAMKNL